MKIKEYIDNLVARGRYYFTLSELCTALSISKQSIIVALCRLKKEKKVASPAKGYYIVVPLEYRSLGSLPPDQFIPDLMKFLKIPYYVGLLSASVYYGAAHQQPQLFQVIIPKPHKNIVIGKVRVAFYTNTHLDHCLIQQFNPPCGTLCVSTPESTALDLITYYRASAGFANILTVLSELVDSMSLSKFRVALNAKKEIATLRRMGYLLEKISAVRFADIVEKHIAKFKFDNIVLNPSLLSRSGTVSKRWKLIINENIESDI